MNCPTCGWGVRTLDEYVKDGYVIGIYECRYDCPVEIRVKSPLQFMEERGKWK